MAHLPAAECRITPGETELAERARADPAFDDHPVGIEVIEGGVDRILARIVVPQRRDRDSASHGQFFKVALVSIPADD